MAKPMIARFNMQPFSDQQKRVMTWWLPESPYYEYDMVIGDGSIRSGKTIAFIASFILWSTSQFQGQNFILAGKSMGALKRNVIANMLQIFAFYNIPYTYNRSSNFILSGIGDYPNTYYLFGADNEASQDYLQGLTAAGAFLDEAALCHDDFREQAIGRCSHERARIWMNCNPETPYHPIKTEYIDRAEDKKILHLFFTLDDNLTLPQRTKDRYKRMFTGLWYKRMILGLWVAAEGAIYDQWDEATHLISDKTLPRNKYGELAYTNYYFGADYATGNPTAIYLIGRAPAGEGSRWDILHEYYYDSKKAQRQLTDREYVEDFKRCIERWFKQLRSLQPANMRQVWRPRVVGAFIDPSAASFRLAIEQAGFVPVVPAINDVVDGIRTVSSLLSEGLLHVHERCKMLIQEFPGYSWDVKWAKKCGEDKPIKENDHALDAIRYPIHTVLVPREGEDSAVLPYNELGIDEYTPGISYTRPGWAE
jgi:PBSX family phage terminase large subunit